MHEVIYLQLGNLPNFVGTHFWNAQNAYAEEEVDTAVSWSEKGIITGNKKETVLRPRALIFDKRGNFGPLQNIALEPEFDGLEPADMAHTWNGPIQSVAEERIPPSAYLARLEDQDTPSDGDKEHDKPPTSVELRYWSDYNHVYFARDTLHPVPMFRKNDVGGEDIIDWADGIGLFEMYDKDHDLMGDGLRRLVEDCDSLQGFQSVSHIPSFGAFSTALLQKTADDYPKSGKLDFAIMGEYAGIWDATNNSVQSSDVLLSNTLALYQLSQLSDVSVPLLPRGMWTESGWRDLIPGLDSTPYHISAIYAVHVESITWPVRRRNAGRGIDSIIRTLNRDGVTPFSCLKGIFPVTHDELKPDYQLELSLPKSKNSSARQILASYNVIRSPTNIGSFGNSSQKRSASGPKDTCLVRNLYPLPLSHPQFFSPLAPSVEGSRIVQEASVFSSLTVESSFRKVLACHADWAEGYVRRGGDLRRTGMESDETREVIEGIRSVIEAYTVGEEVEEEVSSGDDGNS